MGKGAARRVVAPYEKRWQSKQKKMEGGRLIAAPTIMGTPVTRAAQVCRPYGGRGETGKGPGTLDLKTQAQPWDRRILQFSTCPGPLWARIE